MRWVRTIGTAGFLLALSSSALAQTADIPERAAAAKAHPRDARAQTALGFAYLEAGRHAEALKQLERAASLQKDSAEAQTRVAQVYLAQGDFKRAKGLCRKLQREPKPSAMARVCMARTFLAWNRSERAFEELEQAKALDAELREVDLVRGHAHRLRNEVSEAESAYARAKGDPKLAVEADLGLGELYAAAGRKDEALAALRRVLASAPHEPDALYALGVLLGGSDEAQRALAEAFANRPGWADAALALGDARRLANDFSGAETAYREALRSDASLAKAHAGLGEALWRQGKLDEAKLELDRSLSLVANDARATLVLTEVLAQQGMFEEAIELFRHAADLDPRDPSGLTRAAEMLLAQKRMTMAAGFLDRVLTAHPESGQALALYGDVMAGRGDKAQAREYYKRALAAGGVPDRASVESKLRDL
jgi:tetratricopeptide (TPR) repeat protein